MKKFLQKKKRKKGKEESKKENCSDPHPSISSASQFCVGHREWISIVQQPYQIFLSFLQGRF